MEHNVSGGEQTGRTRVVSGELGRQSAAVIHQLVLHQHQHSALSSPLLRRTVLLKISRSRPMFATIAHSLPMRSAFDRPEDENLPLRCFRLQWRGDRFQAGEGGHLTFSDVVHED